MSTPEDSTNLSENILSAVETGNVEKLKELVDVSTLTKREIERQFCYSGYSLLHEAVWSQSFAMVQFVVENFEIDLDDSDHIETTPLSEAFDVGCPIEIINYLIDKGATMGSRLETPLQSAVRYNRHDLVRILEARFGLEPSTELLRTVVRETGDVEMLRFLLDTYKDKALTLIKQDEANITILEDLARSQGYGMEKKVDCFKILYKLLHPGRYTLDSERYNVNDILKCALFMINSNSLIPYFVDTERKWEKRPLVLSLYDRLLPKYNILALIVLCECGPVVGERKELDNIQLSCTARNNLTWTGEIHELFENAIKQGDEGQATESLLLLEDFATFWKQRTLSLFDIPVRHLVKDSFKHNIIYHENNTELLYQPSFHRAVKSMVTLFGDTVEDLLEVETQKKYFLPGWTIAIFSILRYCARMPTGIQRYCLRHNEIHPAAIYQKNFIVHLFSPWKSIQQHVGKPKLQLFTLQRFARDVVRESVWNGVKGWNGAEHLFLEHLQSLNLPKELNEYLRFCDDVSTKYFLKHFDALKHFTGWTVLPLSRADYTCMNFVL